MCLLSACDVLFYNPNYVLLLKCNSNITCPLLVDYRKVKVDSSIL